MTDSTQRFSGELVPKQPQGGGDGSLQLGSVLQNRYRIAAVLGVGGMGSVYLARDQRFTNVIRNVAVKEMLNMQQDPAMREMTLKNFVREADVLASLQHPSIPQIYDVFVSKDRAYLVMEFIDGKDLEAYVSQTPDFIPYETVRKWAIDLCDVLQYLHNPPSRSDNQKPDPIIFRDMKPSNVMIDKTDRIRLIDFGIAKPFQPASQVKGTLIGTDGYAPPEQYRGVASPAGDIYALGATLHHILTKRDPRLEQPFTFNQRPIRSINPRVPVEFEAVVMRALSDDAASRFPSAQAMKEAILAIGSKTGTGPRASAAPASKETGMITEEEADAFKDETLKPVWKFQVEDEIRSSPVVYKGIVYIGTYDNNLYGFNAVDGKPKLKFATKDGIPGTPAIAAEENPPLLLFGSEDGFLYAMDLRSHRIAWSFETGRPVRSSIATAHGHAFFGSDDGFLYAVKLNGRLSWKYDSGAPIRSRPAITEERIVFGNETGDVVGLDLSGSIKWRFKTKRAVSSNPVIRDNIAYVGSQDFHVYAIDVGAGWAAWRFRTGKPIISSPTIVEKTLYIGSADTFLYALDLNGREAWKFKTDGQIVSTPAFANGAVYFGSTDKKVYCLDARRGLKRWEFETEGPITSSPCVVDGILYIGSLDKHLYALNA